MRPRRLADAITQMAALLFLDNVVSFILNTLFFFNLIENNELINFLIKIG